MEYQPDGEESARSNLLRCSQGCPRQPRRLRGHRQVRVQVEADLPGFVPADREDVMVVYGPVRDRRKDLCPAAAERTLLERSQFLNQCHADPEQPQYFLTVHGTGYRFVG
jgi:hypothetical protein